MTTEILLKMCLSQTELERHRSLLRPTSEQQRYCTAASLRQFCQNEETNSYQHKQTPMILALFETTDLCLDWNVEALNIYS